MKKEKKKNIQRETIIVLTIREKIRQIQKKEKMEGAVEEEEE